MTEHQAIKTGTVITVDGHEITVVDINTSENVDGRSVLIRAMDDESARKFQLQKLKQEHIGEDAMDAMKKLIGMFSGGKFPGMDFTEGDK